MACPEIQFPAGFFVVEIPSGLVLKTDENCT